MRRARNRRQRRRVVLQNRQHHILDLLHKRHSTTLKAKSDKCKVCQKCTLWRGHIRQDRIITPVRTSG